MPRLRALFALALVLPAAVSAQAPAAQKLFPNLESNIERPLRYRPDGAAFVIENGAEFFNRSLYGGNTAFRVDGGDKPEFVLYLPGRGGNLRLGVHTLAGTKWLHDATQVQMRYEPGELRYEIRDPLLGVSGALRLAALAYHQTEGLVVRVEGSGLAAGVELVWAYGGINGQRGKRDGDIGTENVPIGEWFQLKPEFARDNRVALTDGGFTITAKAATITGVAPSGSALRVADATQWNDPATLLTARYFAPPAHPVIVGRVTLASGQPVLLSLQRVAVAAPAAEDLDTYKEVTAPSPTAAKREAPKSVLASVYPQAELARRFADTERYFALLRTRVKVETPDPFLNAAVGALNVAADAAWDDPQRAIMHGAIAWRTRLLGWRGPYSLDALGWHDRAREHFEYWATRQNTEPIPEKLPAPEEKTNLARNETGLHSNGDLSNSHYDMNLVYVDALFRHLRWTGDLDLARKLWPVIERHLAWERRLFRREYTVGAEKLPLYEAYAAIWASDDLQYHGGGTAHASAYNYFHHREAARLAGLLGRSDAGTYAREADLIARGMRELLWLPGRNWFGEYKDWLGRQEVHPAAALWTFYHTMDSGLPTALEARGMAHQVDTRIPHLPVRGPGVPAGLQTLASSNWLPYSWSINNVVMGEAVHTALGYWQAGRPDAAWRIAKGSLVAAMFMGISPGNVGSMSYLDVYRRESQRDFADGSGVLSRALIEGLFGVQPDALAGTLTVEPGFPAEWGSARLDHPDVAFSFTRDGDKDTYVIDQRFSKPLAARLRIPASRAEVKRVTVNGSTIVAAVPRDPTEKMALSSPAVPHLEIVIEWNGAVRPTELASSALSTRRESPVPTASLVGAKLEPVDLGAQFNDRVTEIFRHEYRTPRSPFVSLAIPKQGIGAWAGHVNETAEIDDSGLRRLAAASGGKVALENGLIFATPAATEAKNVLFVSQWDNFPREASLPLAGRAKSVRLMMAGSTNHMQSRFSNGEVVVTYADGSTAGLALENPSTWWPIEQDYFIDDYQFRVEEPLPARLDLRTGRLRVLDAATFKGQGGKVPGGAATILALPLDPAKELKSLTVRALANEVVIGLMAATLER